MNETVSLITARNNIPMRNNKHRRRRGRRRPEKHHTLRVVVESKRAWLDVLLSSAFHAQSGCRLYQHILFEATVPFPLNSILVLPRIPYDPRLILKSDSQKSSLLQIRVVLLMHKFHMLYPSPARIRCQYECHVRCPVSSSFPINWSGFYDLFLRTFSRSIIRSWLIKT